MHENDPRVFAVLGLYVDLDHACHYYTAVCIRVDWVHHGEWGSHTYVGRCDAWRAEEFCTDPKHSDWMAVNCPRACGKCEAAGALPSSVRYSKGFDYEELAVQSTDDDPQPGQSPNPSHCLHLLHVCVASHDVILCLCSLQSVARCACVLPRCCALS
jgi:hypothetical protein